MWLIYIFIAALLQAGAFSNPIINNADHSPCTIEIKHFNEPVTTLEVEWNSTIELVCDASCVGPGPQPGIMWFYKNETTLIDIEKLFRPQKFETYPTYFHRKNELVIRNFGENEATKFICEGSLGNKTLNAEVVLTGTECLLKYNFRCQVSNRCIDRSDLCNYHDDCPDGEDEKDCGKNIDYSTPLSESRLPGKNGQAKQTWEEGDYLDITTTLTKLKSSAFDKESEQTSRESNQLDVTMTVSTSRMPETSVEKEQTPRENSICLEGRHACKDFSQCINKFQRCDGVSHCADGSDEENCHSDKEEISTVDTGKITVRYSILDSVKDVAKTTEELTDFTTPFNYDDYIYDN